MDSQPGAPGGRRHADAKTPVNEVQGDRVPETMVTPPVDEAGDHHTEDATPEYLGSRHLKTTNPNSVSIPLRAGCKRASSKTDSKRMSHEPPVTKATLSELDVPRIIFNPKLRHDVNFDPDLHFRPNLDGEKGRRKAQKQNEFWECLRVQLEAFMNDQPKFVADLGEKKWCLPLTLDAIREILVTLVPPQDRAVVEGILNVNLLMQQFSKGVADLEKLALWLSHTLKSHCAPMRDEWVDEMVKQLSSGNLNRDIPLLVQGLQTLLAILESMKLDVANHQIRCLRPLLIQDTIEFEQTYFMKKIATHKIDVRAAYKFFQTAENIQDYSAGILRAAQRDMWIFFKGLTNILRPSNAGFKIPDTFIFDDERIIKLRSKMLDTINLDVCIRLFQNEYQRSRNFLTMPPSTPSTAPSTPSLSCNSGNCSSRSMSPISRSRLPSPSLVPILDLQNAFRNSETSKETGRQRGSSQVSEDNSSLADGEHRELESNSLLSSMMSPFASISSPTSFPRCWGPSLEASELALRQSILALLDDSLGENRWQLSCPAIALQILRSIHSLDTCTAFELKLRDHIGNSNSNLFQAAESSTLADFYALLDDLVVQYSQLSSTQLFEIGSATQKLPPQPPSRRNALCDVAKQTAHIGILHWRVWAPLVYLVDPDTEETDTRTRDRTSGGVSETTPQNPTCHSRNSAANRRPRKSSARQNSISEIPTGTSNKP